MEAIQELVSKAVRRFGATASANLSNLFNHDMPADEVHRLSCSGTFDRFEDRRHRENAHEFTPMTGELAR